MKKSLLLLLVLLMFHLIKATTVEQTLTVSQQRLTDIRTSIYGPTTSQNPFLAAQRYVIKGPFSRNGDEDARAWAVLNSIASILMKLQDAILGSNQGVVLLDIDSDLNTLRNNIALNPAYMDYMDYFTIIVIF